ncbi:MAG: CHAD domain-containing protein [Gammaproteobacteria bacterium]|nr:CHAD domain-containing protein [Gammaproteobacteria bacterium]
MRPDLPAILARQLACHRELLPAIRADQDPDILHRFRVTLRRGRVALRELGGRPARRLSRDLRWLTAATAARDHDLLLGRLAEFRATAGPPVPGLDRLVTAVAEQRERSVARLLACLDDQRYAQILKRWQRLAKPGRKMDLREQAAESLWLAFAHLNRDLRAAGPGAPAVELHRLRKSAKRFRYLLEFDTPGGRAPKKVLRCCRALQDALGGIQDCSVQQRLILDYRDALVPEYKPAAADAILAWLRGTETAYRKQVRSALRKFRKLGYHRELIELINGLREPAREAPMQHDHELLLLRHAKSDWDSGAGSDFERPLNRRGREDAPRVGQLLSEKGWVPDFVRASPALRAWQTTIAACEEVGFGGERIEFDRRLYLADLDRLLGVLRETPDVVRRLLLVGHNPGFEDLARHLGVTEPADGKFLPTASLARIAFNGSWSALTAGEASTVNELIRPKDL